MPKANLADMVRDCQRLLRPETFADWEGAVNGLQVENSGAVTRIAAAVDASLATLKLAAAARADLLIVHHGLFWAPTVPWTSRRREMLALLIKSNLAVYSSHLPLDAHPRLGNNAQLCAALGLGKLKPFFSKKAASSAGKRGKKFRAANCRKDWPKFWAVRPCFCPAVRHSAKESAS